MSNVLEDFSNMLKKQSTIKEEKVNYYTTKLKDSEVIIDKNKCDRLYNLINTITRLSDPWRVTDTITYEEIDRRILELKNAKILLSKILDQIDI